MNDGSGLQYLINDHLSSASLVIDAAGAKVSEQRYYPWGEIRGDIPGGGLVIYAASPRDGGIIHLGSVEVLLGP